MEPHPFPPEATEGSNRHVHHQHHTAEAGEQPAPDPIAVIEEALLRLGEDVGVLAEAAVVQAFAELKTTDMASYLRLRHAAKVTNRACSVTLLDQLPGGKEGTSTLAELVALARAQCQLHLDSDRNAIAILPLPGRREVWRAYSAGFEHWLRAAYWRAKQAGVADTPTRKAIVITIRAHQTTPFWRLSLRACALTSGAHQWTGDLADSGGTVGTPYRAGGVGVHPTNAPGAHRAGCAYPHAQPGECVA